MTVGPGEIRALVGGNGSGKSTFIKILSGYHHPDEGGEIRIGGKPLHFGRPRDSHRLGARFVHQDLGLIDDCSVLDNLCLDSGFPTRMGTIRGTESRERARSLLMRVGLDLDPAEAVRDLSAAEKTGLAVARALIDSPSEPIRLLVLDEPTATLPATEVRVLLEMVRSIAASGVGVLYVTHRLDEVFEIAAAATVLRNGKEVITTPVAHLTRSDLVHHLVGSEVVEVRQDEVPTNHGGRSALRVEGLRSAGIADVTFEVAPGEIVGVSGVTGSGRETLAGALFGSLPRQDGVVTVGDVVLAAYRPDASIRSGVAFMPSDRKIHGGMMNMSARENLTLATLREFWSAPYIRRNRETAETKRWFERLDVHPSWAYQQPLLSFSGGNQQKVLLGKWLRLEPKVLLLEEPTQGVDIGAKTEIHRQLLQAAASGTAIVVSSSDIDELVALCSRVIVLREGRIAKTLTGSDLTIRSVTHESLSAHRSWGVHRQPQTTQGVL